MLTRKGIDRNKDRKENPGEKGGVGKETKGDKAEWKQESVGKEKRQVRRFNLKGTGWFKIMTGILIPEAQMFLRLMSPKNQR